VLVEQVKEVIRDPRPDEPVKFLNTNRFNSGRPGEQKGRSYGMPSGHASGVAFTLTFVYLMTYKYLLPSIAFLGITVTERFMFKNHTLAQLVAGTILGVATATLLVYTLKHFKL
jgi:membrane-associated phospholipid phosphatase